MHATQHQHLDSLSIAPQIQRLKPGQTESLRDAWITQQNIAAARIIPADAVLRQVAPMLVGKLAVGCQDRSKIRFHPATFSWQAGPLVSQLGRVSAAEYFQGAFGQKGSSKCYRTAMAFLACPNWKRPRVDALTPLILGLEAVSFARTAPANRHEGPSWDVSACQRIL